MMWQLTPLPSRANQLLLNLDVGMLDREAPAWFIPLDNCFLLPLLLYLREMGFFLLYSHHIKGAAGNTSVQGSEKPLNNSLFINHSTPSLAFEGEGQLPPPGLEGKSQSCD